MRPVIGVMGGGVADEATLERAREIGVLVAREGWVLLNGGRDCGVMAASAAGAHDEGGLVIGILPDEDATRATPNLDVAILTGMGDARNVINVLSSSVIVAMRGGAGTISEVAHALKLGRPVVVLDLNLGGLFPAERASGRLVDVDTPLEAIAAVRHFLAEETR